MALTDLGFERPVYDEILEQQIERAKTLFGETIDTSEQTILGKYIRLNAADIDALYQDLEGVYYARFPNTASGTSLDRLCPFAGISRNPATNAKHEVKFTGVAGEAIDAGFEVSTENQSVVFYTTDDYVIGENGEVTAEVECEETGTVGNVAIGAINTIVFPSPDIDSVEHIRVISLGEDIESDTALRERFNQAVAGTGSTTAESIKASIMRITGVSDCTIVENSTSETVQGIPPYSFECFVLCAESAHQEIANAIFQKKPIGIKSYGDISVEVEDDGGNTHTVSFSQTHQKNIYIKIELTKNNYFEENGVEDIKSGLINYLATFSNGDDVYLSSLYSFINVNGVVTVTSLKMSTNGTTYSAENVFCNDSEVARTAVDLIDITVNEVE